MKGVSLVQNIQHLKSPFSASPFLFFDRTKTSHHSTTYEHVADALRSSGADILIEPVYEIQTTGNSTHVTVTGFPGRYTNFRQAEPRDSLFIDSRILQKPQTVEQSESPSYRGSMLIPAIGIFVGTAVLAYFLGWGTAD